MNYLQSLYKTTGDSLYTGFETNISPAPSSEFHNCTQLSVLLKCLGARSNQPPNKYPYLSSIPAQTTADLQIQAVGAMS